MFGQFDFIFTWRQFLTLRLPSLSPLKSALKFYFFHVFFSNKHSSCRLWHSAWESCWLDPQVDHVLASMCSRMTLFLIVATIHKCLPVSSDSGFTAFTSALTASLPSFQCLLVDVPKSVPPIWLWQHLTSRYQCLFEISSAATWINPNI